VVLDMMIHDIDVVLSLVSDRPSRVEAVGINVLGPYEDIANARVTFEGGCVVNLTASRLALKTERKIRVFSEQAYLSMDYQRRSGIAITKDANLDILRLARERKIDDLASLAGTDFGSMVKVEPLAIDPVDPLQQELEAFAKAVQTRSAPPAGAAEAVEAMALADAIVGSIHAHRWDGSEAGRVGLDSRLVSPDV
jgi:predicted dehydrogenase